MIKMGAGAEGIFKATEYQGVGALYFLFGGLGCLTNILFLVVFTKQRVLNSPKNILHINLAIANIGVVAGFPFSGLSSIKGKWLFGEAGCQAYGVESFLTGIAALTFVSLLCVERYIANCKKEFYETMSPGTWWFIAMLVWMYSTIWGLFPVLGWSSYSMEAAGVSCGIDWLRKDYNHTSYSITLSVASAALFVVACYCLYFAKDHLETTTTKGSKSSTDWLTEKQLIWICLAFLVFALIGWGPYGYFAIWTALSDLKSVTMLASTLPPLFAKGAVSLYPIPFLVASDRFREACTGQPLTNPVPKKGN